MQNDDLDVLPTHVHDDVRILVELQRRFRMSDSLDQSHVRIEHILQNVFCISGCRNPENFHLRVLRFNLIAQVLEHFDGVLNRIAIRELIRLAKNIAVFIQQDCFGRRRTAINANETANRSSALKDCRSEFLGPYATLNPSSSPDFSINPLPPDFAFSSWRPKSM